MLQKVKEEVAKCKELVAELDEALKSTMHSSKGFNDDINEARARMKECLREMRESELPPPQRT
jgi:hypothetical protein